MIFRFHPRVRCGLLWRVALCIVLGCVVQPAWAQKGKQKVAAPPISPDGKDIPDATIPLEPLGYQGAPQHLLLSGVVTSSVHYVDAHHILLTYRARMLIPRGAEEKQGEGGQMVVALLLESPSGKVLARTQWRLYDHGQYLWPMGRGTFVLRKGNELGILMPLAAGSEKDPLRASSFTELPGPASTVMVSPDGRMVIAEAEIVTRQAAAASVNLVGGAVVPASAEQHSTDIQFWQFDLSDVAHGRVSMSKVGHSTAHGTLGFPLSGDGYLRAEMVSPDDWNLFYAPWRGGAKLLGDVVSTCPPQSMFLNSSEFLVVTCNGGDGNREMTVASLDRHELWQEAMGSDTTDPDVRTAAESGRFAISRILRNGGGSTALLDVIPADSITAQRVEVRDIKNGMLVATVDAEPVQRAAQNFSLSDDGMHLAVLQHDAIAIYDLAPMKDFPAPKIKPKDIIFVPAADVPATAAKPAAAEVAQPTVIEAPLNVDERQAPPTLYTPEEQAERDRKAAEKQKKRDKQ